MRASAQSGFWCCSRDASRKHLSFSQEVDFEQRSSGAIFQHDLVQTGIKQGAGQNKFA